jgi:fatty acid desaturase
MQVVSTRKYLSAEERISLLKKNDWKAIFGIAYQLGLLIFAFAISYFYPHPLVYLVSIFIIGGRQLSCAVLTHDASHFALFNNKKVNDFVGRWFGGYPVFQNLIKYRHYHVLHHKNNGLEEDPDLLLTRGYPTSKRSMFRKFARDLSGMTGLKYISGLFLMEMGYLEYNLGNKITRTTPSEKGIFSFISRFFNAFGGAIAANLIIFLCLYVLGAPQLYLLWVIAFFTTLQFSIRVRAIAEHSVIEDRKDPLLNTRTTYANFFERIFFAPYHVNYHAEHHMLMGVPPYNLPKMHRLIKANGYYKDGGVLAKNYWEVIKMAASELR